MICFLFQGISASKLGRKKDEREYNNYHNVLKMQFHTF
jgi:hypothetical protein